MLLIQNALLVDPGSNRTGKADIFIKDGKIAAIDSAPADLRGVTILDAAGMVAAPGLVDMHVHFRDPGFLYKEDVYSGARAAAAGGVTTAVCMPNTKPVLDSSALLRAFMNRAEAADITVLAYAAVTAEQRGQTLTDADALQATGAAGLSDDGMPVMDASIVRSAMRAAADTGLLIISHCEDATLARDFAVNEGVVSAQLGLPGRPAIAEDLMVQRDILLARETGARVHIAHVSTASAVDLIRRAKDMGVAVTAETCPHYFTLTEDAVLSEGAMARVNPPLRTQADVNAVLDGLCDGTLDAIVTDHAPHSAEEKALPLDRAPSGISGLETSLGLAVTALYHTGRLSLDRIIRLMSTSPADILGLKKGRLDVGDDADLVLFDTDTRWTVDPASFRSKGRNTPFAGRTLQGKVHYTIRGGDVVYKGE